MLKVPGAGDRRVTLQPKQPQLEGGRRIVSLKLLLFRSWPPAVAPLVAFSSWSMKKTIVKCYVAVCSAALVLCFAGLAAMEVFSKGSSLGCPAPIFIVVWYLIALLPAIIHSSFAMWRRSRGRGKALQVEETCDAAIPSNWPLREASDAEPLSRQIRFERAVLDDERRENKYEELTTQDHEKSITSAIQGANEAWPVQLTWSTYYIAGTLVFSSIMAVTVPELVIWVVLGLSTAACSKVLAFFLCLVFENTGI